MNNLFQYATSELSQDAVLCWCINAFNCSDETMREMSKEVITLLTDEIDLEKEEKVIIHRQIYKTDILLYFPNNKVAWIIEDKVYTSEHHNQIAVYKEKILSLDINDKDRFGFDLDYEVRTCYFKTGFFYDYDRLVVADKVVEGKKLYDILIRYAEYNLILKMFCEYFKEWYIDWYEKYRQYMDTKPKSFWDWNISKHHIAQYYFMKDVFGWDIWDKKSDLFKVYHGSNVGGRAWTQMVVLEAESYSVFWRIDTDNAGVYLSLRMYDVYDKSNEKERETHISRYRLHREQIERIYASNPFMGEWKNVNPGRTENYKEAALITIHINDLLKNYNGEMEYFKKSIENLMMEFRNANIR